MASAPEALAENLQQVWGISQSVNQQLQAQQQKSIASDFQVKAANSTRYFTVRSSDIDAFLAQSPKTRQSIAQNQGSGSPITTIPTIFLLGSKQTFLPVSLTTASIPLSTGEKLTRLVDSARHQLNDLTTRAFQLRSEQAEQARSLTARADATKANLKPKVWLTGGFIFLVAENFIPRGNGFASLIVDWTFTDSGKSRRQGESLKAQQRATT